MAFLFEGARAVSLKNNINDAEFVANKSLFRFADDHNWTELKTASVQYIENNFPKVCKEDEVYDLHKDTIIKFLSSECLKIDSEFQVFQAALRWINHDILARRQYVFDILKNVRLPLLPLGNFNKNKKKVLCIFFFFGQVY